MERKQKDTEVLEQLNGVPVYREMPEGWDYLKGASTAPRGYRWIWNRKSRFTRKNHENVKYKHAFLMEEERRCEMRRSSCRRKEESSDEES